MNDLEELKSLLFGAEKQALDSLSERVQRPETRAADVADVLPEAVRLSHKKGDEIVAELRDPVGKCLKAEFHEAPQDYADALYPVIGPAIRKSIMHALQAFAQQINRTMEHSLSANGLKWRFQAWRLGIPFGEFVMQQTLLYRVEQAYLISRNNGLLIAHVHRDAHSIKDSDAVSAMFTAIQDFVKESFSPDRTGRLETADMGDFTLWAVHGPSALLVCVIRGIPPRSVRPGLTAILERIHFRYGESIRAYAGDASTVEGVEEELNGCLNFQAQQPAKEKKRKVSFPLFFILAGISAALIYAAYDGWQDYQELSRLKNVVAMTPGIYVADITKADNTFTLHGLRDPLAPGVDEIAENAGLDSLQVVSDLRPYQSFDSEILVRRAITAIDPPNSVSASELDGSIVVSGQASQRWINSLQSKIDADSVGMPVRMETLASLERLELDRALSAANGAQFVFANDVVLSPADQIRLEAFSESLSALVAEASSQDILVGIHCIGSTDGTGDLQFNNQLAKQRAQAAADVLIASGIDPILIETSIESSGNSSATPAPDLRRVTIEVTLESE